MATRKLSDRETARAPTGWSAGVKQMRSPVFHQFAVLVGDNVEDLSRAMIYLRMRP